MRKNVRDRSECHHDESERHVGGVKSVGPVDDESHAPIEFLVASIVHAEANRGEYLALRLRMVWAAMTNGLSPLRDALEQNRLSIMATSSSLRSPAKMARSASFSA